MSMQTVASPALGFTPPKRNTLTHIPGDEGWPIIGQTLATLADPKGQVERSAAVCQWLPGPRSVRRGGG